MKKVFLMFLSFTLMTSISAQRDCQNGVSVAITTNVSDTYALLSWDQVPFAISYRVERLVGTITGGHEVWEEFVQTASTTHLWSGLTGGTYYKWRVRADCNPTYQSSSFTTTGGCPGIYDANSNGSPSTASIIPVNNNIKGRINVLFDVDYYKFTNFITQQHVISLTSLPGDYDIELLQSNGTTLIAKSTKNGTSDDFITTTLNPGTYFVKVYGKLFQNNATKCYNLKVQRETTTMRSDETNITTDEKSTTINSDDVQRVRIYPNPVSSTLYVNMTDLKTNGIAQIIDLQGKVVSQSNVANGRNGINIAAISSGVYLLKVTASNGEVIFKDKFIKK